MKNKKINILQKLARFDSFAEKQARIRYEQAWSDYQEKDQELQRLYASQSTSFICPLEWKDWADEYRTGLKVQLEQQKKRTSMALSRVEHEKLVLLEQQKEKKIKERAVERYKLKERSEQEKREQTEESEMASKRFYMNRLKSRY